MEEKKWSVQNAYTELIKAQEPLLKSRLIELLKIESVMDRFDPSREYPFGEGVQEALDFMLKMAKDDGFVTKNIDNYAAHIEYGEGEELLGVLCHLDVVPANDLNKWETPPFEPSIRDGKIYARGAMDDKGPTMAAYMALKLLKDEIGFVPNKRIRIILGTDEESGWRGLQRYFETEEMPTLGFAPDALFPLIYGEKGMYSFTVEGTYQNDALIEFYSGSRANIVPDEAYAILSMDLKEAFNDYCENNSYKGSVEGNKYIIKGRAAHAMHPDHGLNAAYLLADFLASHIDNPYVTFIRDYLLFDAYGEKLGIAYYDEEMKHLTMNNGIFRYSKDMVTIDFNIRYPKGYDLPGGEKNIKAALKKYGLNYQFKSNRNVHYIDPKADLVQTLQSVYEEATGDSENKPITIGGGTYARAIPNGVAFGMAFPGRLEVAHEANEHVHIEDYLSGTMIYMAAIKRLSEN